MTYPTVDDLPEEATSTLLGVCSQLSQSRHRGLARWAASVSDALLVRLVSVTTGVHVGGTTTEPGQPLAKLDAAELEGLYSVLLAGAEASDDESVVRWCTRMSRLIVAEVCRRELMQRGDRRRSRGTAACLRGAGSTRASQRLGVVRGVATV